MGLLTHDCCTGVKEEKGESQTDGKEMVEQIEEGNTKHVQAYS